MPRISILDLTVDQIERIEQAENLPLSKWAEAPSMVRLYVRILAAANGDDEERYRRMTLRELTELVTLGGDDPNP